METFIKRALMLLTVTAAFQAGFALAEDVKWVSVNDQTTTLVSDNQSTSKEQPQCASCYDEGSCGGCGSSLGCDGCPGYGVVGVFGFDSFKGISDSNYPSNYGVVTGLNAAMPVSRDYGIGWQLGMTYGVYDVDGRTVSHDNAQSQQQTFITTGFFHKANECQRLSYGLVYDWMLNNNWGVFGNSPTMGQCRGQVEWAYNGCNAFGVYGCLRDLYSTHYLNAYPIINRPISQGNLFWHHKFESAADSYLWVGIPERERLSHQGSLGDWIVGANIQVPFTSSLALSGNVQYMHPSASAGATASQEAAWDIGVGVVWYIGRNAVSHSINGKCWTPYMPVANNSTFLVDQNSLGID
jgi:hypothetical protein